MDTKDTKTFTDFEQFDEKQLGHLIKALGYGAQIIDWNDIDYELGRGIGDGADRSIWGKDGRRIDVFMGVGTFGASQTEEPDPLYQSYKSDAAIVPDDDEEGV